MGIHSEEDGKAHSIGGIQLLDTVINTIISIVVTVLASSGFWAFLQIKKDRHDGKTQLLIGLAHDRIVFLGMSYIDRGYVTSEEYHNLYDRIYKPYSSIAPDDGSVKKVMQDLEHLPIYKPVYISRKDEDENDDEQ